MEGTKSTAEARIGTAVKTGDERPSWLSYQALLDTDTHSVPDVLRRTNPIKSGPSEIPIERYLSRDFFDLEVERLWKRIWQVACREEDIPNVGDNIVYDIAGMSFVVVRTAPDSFKAFYNACLHRGRLLRESGSFRATELPVSVSRVRMEYRRHPQACALSVGLSSHSTVGVVSA